MITVHQVSELTGVSIRTLHHYHSIGLLAPSATTESGYRLYDDTALERLQQILLFRELEFPLKEIRRIMESPDFDRNGALEQQIALLTLKQERLSRLIRLARKIKNTGGNNMDFSAFDTKKIEEYAAQAKAAWGDTDAYKEFEEKSKERSMEQTQDINREFMDIFAQLGALKAQSPDAPAVQEKVKALQSYITEHFYTCTKEILAGLGQMYAAGGSMGENIDLAGGPGTAAFAAEAIRSYCQE